MVSEEYSLFSDLFELFGFINELLFPQQGQPQSSFIQKKHEQLCHYLPVWQFMSGNSSFPLK